MKFLNKDISELDPSIVEVLEDIPESIMERWKEHKPIVDVEYIKERKIIENILPYIGGDSPSKINQYILVDNSLDLLYLGYVFAVIKKQNHMESLLNLPPDEFQEIMSIFLSAIKKSNPMIDWPKEAYNVLWYGVGRYTPAHQSPSIAMATYCKESFPDLYERLPIMRYSLDMAEYVGWWTVTKEWGIISVARN